MQSWEIFFYSMDSNYCETYKMFWQTIRRHRSKIDRYIKDKNGLLLGNKEDILCR